MANDIVFRLRECWCSDAFSDRGLVDPACDHDGVRAEAADEIERLREIVDERNDTISRLVVKLELMRCE